MAHPLLILLKPIALKLIAAKISEKTGKIEVADKKTVSVTGSIYLVLVGAILTYMSSTGVIGPELAEMLNTILTSEAVVTEADKAIEKL